MKLLGIVFLAAAVVIATGETIEDCLQKDSISCVQKTLYRKAKELFGKDSFEIVNGVSLVNNEDNQARSARSSRNLIYDQEIDTAVDVEGRQSALENFVGEEAKELLTGRSLRINLAPAFEKITASARAISESVPEEIRQAVDEVVEGRGKKKILQKILPLLIGAKAKIGALLTLAYFGIALIAKKAIFASLISLAISAFVGLKALWSKSSHDYTPYNKGGWSGAGGSGWSSGGSIPVGNGGWSSGAGWADHHDYAQSQAYGGYHH